MRGLWAAVVVLVLADLPAQADSIGTTGSTIGPPGGPGWRWFVVPALLVVLGSILAAERHRRRTTRRR